MHKKAFGWLAGVSLASATLALAGCDTPATEVIADNGYAIDVIEMDGTSTLAFEASDAFEPAAQSTIEFWVRADWSDTPDFDPVVISSTGEEGSAYLVAIQREKDGIALASGEEIDIAPFDFADGELHHVAFIDLGGPVAVVIDGELIDELDMTLQAMETDGFYVGSAYGGDDGFEGVIGGLRIWDVAVSTDNLFEYRLKDVLSEQEPHPDLQYLSAISNFGEEDIVTISQ